MKRILGFSSIPIENARSAGADRIASLYRHLPDRYEPTLVTLTPFSAPRGEGRLSDRARVHRVPSAPQTFFHYLQRARIAPFFHVSGVHRRFPLAAGRYLRERYDLAQFDSLWLTPWADRLPAGTPVVYGSHNFEIDWYEGEIRRYLFRRFHTNTLARIEREAVNRADRVIAVTEEDRRNFVERLGADPDRIAIVPNGFDSDRFVPPSPEEKEEARHALGLPSDRRIALFAGSAVLPNQDAVESILRAVVPKAPKDVLFVIAGSVGAGHAKGGPENVLFTGEVDDIAIWFRAADVGLNPIRLGSGSNIKVLQYLGAGLAVISTDFGMRGFDDIRERVTIARMDRFHYHVSRATADPGAAEVVRDRYSWRRASALLAAVYAELLGEEAPPGEAAAGPETPLEGRES